MEKSAREILGPAGSICVRCGTSFRVGDGRHRKCRGNATNIRRDKACQLCGEEFQRVAKSSGRKILWSGKKIAAHKLAHFEETA